MPTKSEKMKVSVMCLVYNQEQYIEKALKSILKQKTNFSFEILINDDCSSDNTLKIINIYAKKYPNIVKVTRQSSNQYSKGKRNFNLRYLIPQATGKYLALCEGDDYWTDELKLQKQADFLDSNNEFSMVFHPVRVIYEDNSKPEEIFPENLDQGLITTAELLRRNFIQTNSVMYRKQKYENMNLDVMPGDWYLHLYHAQFGRIGFIDEIMAVYRRHKGGIWWTSSLNNKDDFWIKYGRGHFILYAEMLKLYGENEELKSIILDGIYWMFKTLTVVDSKHNTNIVSSVIKEYPEVAEPYILKLQDLQEESQKVIDDYKKHSSGIEKQLIQAKKDYDKLASMYNSKFSTKLRRKIDSVRSSGEKN